MLSLCSKGSKTRNEVRKGSGKGDEAEELTPEDTVNRQIWRNETES